MCREIRADIYEVKWSVCVGSDKKNRALMWLLIIYVHHDCCCSCLWSWRGDVCLCVKEGVCACWCCSCMQPVCDGCVVRVCVVESPLYEPCPALALPNTTRSSLYFAECADFAQMLIFFSACRVLTYRSEQDTIMCFIHAAWACLGKRNLLQSTQAQQQQ